MASTRGRGYTRGASDSPNAQALRRPGEAGLIQRIENLASMTIKSDVKFEVSEVFNKMLKMDFNAKTDVSPLTEKVKSVCLSVEDMENCIEIIFEIASKSKWNAHVAAIFCDAIGDFTIVDAKFRTHLLRKLQVAYKERVKQYLELDSFLMNVTFLCEIYHHVRIDGKCLKVLSRPVIDYFGMLIDGASLKEVEIFVEQFPKCYISLKESDESGLDTLLSKIRKQIICKTSDVVVIAMLLEIFENMLTEFKPLSESTKNQYESFAKPVLRICE